uniref:Uncharacterized protein n=1 Tax=Anguilla anguilla TaxID=7936 RepID=A0A0E9U9N4_ANGAN
MTLINSAQCGLRSDIGLMLPLYTQCTVISDQTCSMLSSYAQIIVVYGLTLV